MNPPACADPRMSLDDFEELLADCPEDERWELISGRVVRMMVGARWEHNFIITNLAYALEKRLRDRGSPCRTFRETFRLKEDESSSSLLPDLMVYCSRPPVGATYLDDATVLIEVLSQGTARRDREDKWLVYQTLPSLKHYVLVERDRPHVESIERAGGSWSAFQIADGLDAVLRLGQLDLEIPLAEIYEDLFSAGDGSAARK